MMLLILFTVARLSIAKWIGSFDTVASMAAAISTLVELPLVQFKNIVLDPFHKSNVCLHALIEYIANSTPQVLCFSGPSVGSSVCDVIGYKNS